MGAGDQTTVASGQVATFERAASDAAERLTNVLGTLIRQLEPLSANWVGRGGTAFQSASTTVQTEATRMNTALRGIAADVGIAGRNYLAADEEQNSTMTQVSSATTGITSALVL